MAGPLIKRVGEDGHAACDSDQKQKEAAEK